MDGATPVLTERKDIKMWKRLVSLENAAAKGSNKKNVDKLRNIIQEILDTDDYANPKIVVKLMDLVDLYLSDEIQVIILEILEKCELTDCAPQMKAAKKLVSMGSYDTAKLILDRMTVISDVLQWEYLRGVVDAREGNIKSACKHFLRAYEMNDRFIPIYNEMEQIDPENGWFYRGMIASVMNGDVPESHTSEVSGRYGELYNIYWEWSNGGGFNAMEAVKRIVRENIETDVELAMARFYMEDKKIPEAMDHYRKAAESNLYFIKLEMAEALLRSGNYADALSVCEELEKRNISDRRLIELQMRIVTAMKDRKGLVKYVSVYLYNDYADFDAYVNSIKSYIELNMHSEASNLLDELSAMDPDDPIINFLSSKNDYSSGRYPAALVTAKKAVRKMPDDIECLLHISRVYMAKGRSEKKALKYINTILMKDGQNRDAMILKKDIFKNAIPPEYESARMMCEEILKVYPDDTETMKDLAHIYSRMGKDKESLEMYRKALDIMNDPVLFMEIINSLARAQKYDDVVMITKDYDDVYGNIVDMWAIRGNAEYATQKYDDAIESFTKATEMDYNNHSFWHSKGMAEEMAGEYDLAEVSYDKAVLMDLDNPDYWISKAVVQEKKGDYPGAITSLNRVISMHPDHVYSLMRKAMILIRLGKVEEARSFIDLSSKIEPQNMKIMIARRDIYCKLQDTDATKTVCKTILNANPSDKRTVIILSRTYIDTKSYDDARSLLVRYSNIDDGGFTDEYYEIYHMLREIYHIQGQTHEEISTCKTILSYRPDDRATKVALAEAYIKRNMIDAAKALYDELHQQSPEDSDFSLKKAMMAESSEAKLSVLMESLTNDPDNKDILLEVAKMLFDDGKTKDALIYVNRALDSDPTDPMVYVRKMEILSSIGDHRGVLEVAGEASSNAIGTNPLVWKISGDSQTVLGDYSNAMISYDTAMKMGINTSGIYHSRGMCQEASGLYDAAISSYTIAYQKDPLDTDSMIRVAAIYLVQNKDQMAGRELDKAIAADPLCSRAIIARATIFAAKTNEIGLKRLFDQCISKGVDDETKERVAELMEKAKAKEFVEMPVIRLVMPTLPILEEGPSDEVPDEVDEEDSEEDTSDEELPEDGEILPDIGEQSSESEEDASDEELPEDGFVVDDDSDTGFFMVASEDEEVYEKEKELPESESEPVIEEEPSIDVESVTEQPEEQTDEASSAEEVPEEESEEITKSEEESVAESEEEPINIEKEPEEAVVVVEEEPAVEIESVVEAEEPEEAVVVVEDEQVPESKEETASEEGSDGSEEPKTPVDEGSVEAYALKVLEYAHKADDVPGNDEIAAIVGIPADMVEPVFNYLQDFEEYGKIKPGTKDFDMMEEMSYNAIIRTGANDIEDDPVLSLTSAYYESGAKDINIAKRLVSYVYEALTCEMPSEPFSMRISDIADKVEFEGSPNTVYDIMQKYEIGVYSARLVKALVFRDDGSIISHI